MHTAPIHIDRAAARDLYREYRKHQHYSTPVDRECMRAYQLLAQGRLIIKAIESVLTAGVDTDGFPKLALCRAHETDCQLRLGGNGSASMIGASSRRSTFDNRLSSKRVDFPAGSFPIPAGPRGKWHATAMVPPVPLHLRPKRGLPNYHILWEAEWTRIPPRDPFLLRRIGIGDMWLVVAMWDLTEVERAALAARIPNA